MSVVDRTVIHGVAESVADFSKLPSQGNMSSECLAEDVLSKHLYDAGQKAWLPMEYIAFVYDVGEHGNDETGAALTGQSIPAGTIVVGGVLVVADAFTAATSSPQLALAIVAENDTLAAYDVAAESVNARIATVPLLANAATWILVTAETTPSAYVSGGTFAKGRLYGYLMAFRNVIGGDNSSSSSHSSSVSSASSSSHSSSSQSSESSSSEGA